MLWFRVAIGEANIQVERKGKDGGLVNTPACVARKPMLETTVMQKSKRFSDDLKKRQIAPATYLAPRSEHKREQAH